MTKTKSPTKKLGSSKPADNEVRKVRTTKVAKQPKLDYHLEVSVNDTVYKGDAMSLQQALEDFVKSTSFPFSIKTRVFLKYGKEGEEMQQRTYPVHMARRIFHRISFRESALEILANKLYVE